jgi:aryl sulfotransferase
MKLLPMDNMGPEKIVWLASYPKSGNTWMRAFLTALFKPEKDDLDINNMVPNTIASSRQLFDDLAGVSASDLLPGEIDRLRPAIYRQNALESEEMIYHKIHDAWILLPDGEPLIPADVTRAVIYIIRNPLDVAVSFANHLNCSIDKAIAIMNNPGYAFCDRRDRLANQLKQQLLTWSGHVKSWVDESGLPVWVMRYEDMSAKPEITFTKALNFIGLQHTTAEIKSALELCSFTRLQKQEEEKGFSEKSARSPSFFRKGKVGDWQNFLTREQVEKIIDSHGGVMRRYGYMDGK